MDQNIIKFNDTEIKKHKFIQHKSPILINNTDINKVVVSNEIPFVKKDCKYFSGYKNAKKFRPLCIFLPKMSAYKRDFGKTKYMSLLIKDDELLKNVMECWKKSEEHQKRIR